MKAPFMRVTLREVVLIPMLLVLCIVAALAAERSLLLLAVPSIAIVFALLALLNPQPSPVPLSSLVIAPDHVGVAGERIPLKGVRRIEQLAAGGGHEVVVHTETGATTVARTREPAHARYVSDRVEEVYRAFLRRG